MDDKLLEEVKGMVEALDAKVPTEGAAVQFVLRGEGPEVEATALGFMRLGVCLLKAGCASPEKVRDVIVPEMDKLVSENSELRFVSAALREELRPPDKPGQNKPGQKRLRDRFALLGCALVALVVLMLMIGGVLFWFGKSVGH
jgi:hypothetical protein